MIPYKGGDGGNLMIRSVVDVWAYSSDTTGAISGAKMKEKGNEYLGFGLRKHTY